MEQYKNSNNQQIKIITLSVAYVFLAAGVAILIFHFSDDKLLGTALGGSSFFSAIAFLAILAFQLKKIKAHTEKSHTIIQREAEKISQRDRKLKEILEKLEKEKDKAVILEKLKSDFVTIMAHKFRTPLSQIKWALDSLNSPELSSSEKGNLLKQTAASNELLINLVDELLNVTLLEEGAFSYHFSAHSLEGIIKEIIKGFEHALKSKKVDLIFSPSIGTDCTFKMDKDKFIVAVGNIIDNAIKYSNAAKPVEVNLKKEFEKFILSISNSGAGIPANEQDKLFTKFFRGEKAIPMDTEGFGLGLYFSKEIIEAHGGTITFESRPNEKTVFYITLPANH